MASKRFPVKYTCGKCGSQFTVMQGDLGTGRGHRLVLDLH